MQIVYPSCVDLQMAIVTLRQNVWVVHIHRVLVFCEAGKLFIDVQADKDRACTAF